MKAQAIKDFNNQLDKLPEVTPEIQDIGEFVLTFWTFIKAGFIVAMVFTNKENDKKILGLIEKVEKYRALLHNDTAN